MSIPSLQGADEMREIPRMSDVTAFHGSCHCGAVKFDAFKLVSGEGALTARI